MTDKSKQVAVKCVKPGASANYIRAVMSELKVMLFIKSHDNVVQLVGAYTRDLVNRKCHFRSRHLVTSLRLFSGR